MWTEWIFVLAKETRNSRSVPVLPRRSQQGMGGGRLTSGRGVIRERGKTRCVWVRKWLDSVHGVNTVSLGRFMGLSRSRKEKREVRVVGSRTFPWQRSSGWTLGEGRGTTPMSTQTSSRSRFPGETTPSDESSGKTLHTHWVWGPESWAPPTSVNDQGMRGPTLLNPFFGKARGRCARTLTNVSWHLIPV